MSHMAFAHCMLLESIGVSALFLAWLTVPSQPLKTFGLHAVGDKFRGTDFSFTHGVEVVVELFELAQFAIEREPLDFHRVGLAAAVGSRLAERARKLD